MGRGRLKEKHRDWIAAAVFVAPLLLGTILFLFIPILQSFYYSMTKWNGVQTAQWVGFENYARIAGDTVFHKEFLNTFYFVFVSVPVSMILSLLVASLLNTKIKGLTAFRVIYFLPNVTMSVVVATMWTLMFNSRYGIINDILEKLFGIRPNWLSDPGIVMIVVIAVAVWASVGYNVIILLAALQNVPTAYYEACDIDGATAFHKFFYITLPMVSPSVFFLLVTSIIKAFNSFDLVFMFAQSPGPIREALRTMVYGIYNTGIVNYDMGYASAKAVVLFAIIMVISLIQFIGQKKWVHY